MSDESDDSPFLRSANRFLNFSDQYLVAIFDSELGAGGLVPCDRTSHYRSLVIGSSIVHKLVHVPKFITVCFRFQSCDALSHSFDSNRISKPNCRRISMIRSQRIQCMSPSDRFADH